MFSAAHTRKLQEASRTRDEQALEPAQPKLLLKRGFYSEGGRTGWGYYLEPASPPSPVASSSKHANGDAGWAQEEGGAGADEDEDASDARRHGKRRRETRGSRAEACPRRPAHEPRRSPTSIRTLIASHGASSAPFLLPPSQPPPLPGCRIARGVVRKATMAVKTRALVSLWYVECLWSCVLSAIP